MTRSSNDNDALSRRTRTVLLATDNKNSILAEAARGQTSSIAYSPYGQQTARQKIATRLGFNGELREDNIGWYLLGNGYRAYNPTLMRFHSPDSWSPFGGGGLNAYMYCVGDPVNFSDPTGHVKWGKFFSRVSGFFSSDPDAGPRGALITPVDLNQRIHSLGQMNTEPTGELSALFTIGGEVLASAPAPAPRLAAIPEAPRVTSVAPENVGQSRLVPVVPPPVPPRPSSTTQTSNFVRINLITSPPTYTPPVPPRPPSANGRTYSDGAGGQVNKMNWHQINRDVRKGK